MVKYLRKGEYQGSEMTIGKTYEVIGIEGDYYRIVDDSYMPYLYNPNQFEIVDSSRPDFWISGFEEEDEEYSYPKDWGVPGFFEDFHDGVEEVVSKFWSDCEFLYGISKIA